MTNRPLDYEHPFARLVPNDTVTPTTEVVTDDDIPLPPLKHVGTMQAKMHYRGKLKFVPDFDDEEPEQEPQTGWRFLGFDDERIYLAGKFTVGKIYQLTGYPTEAPGSERFYDDDGYEAWQETRYFEQVK